MKIFWENIIRYSKFLITTLAGLMFLVSENFFGLLSLIFGNYTKNIKLKNKKTIILFFCLTFCLFFFLKLILSL